MKRSNYDRQPRFWSRQEKSIQSDFLCRPHVIKTLGDVNGLKIADIGCGEGYVSRMLAKRGAEVIGVDVSERLIRLAQQQEKKHPQGIRYLVAPAQDLHFIKSNSQDAAISVLVFCCFKKDSDAIKALKETHRILRPDGEFILALPHPLDIAQISTGWVKYSDGKVNYWSLGPIHKQLIKSSGEQFEIENYHRPLEKIVSMVITARFRIEGIIEPKPSSRDCSIHKTRWTKEKDIPYYIIMKLRKE